MYSALLPNVQQEPGKYASIQNLLPVTKSMPTHTQSVKVSLVLWSPTFCLIPPTLSSCLQLGPEHPLFSSQPSCRESLPLISPSSLLIPSSYSLHISSGMNSWFQPSNNNFSFIILKGQHFDHLMPTADGFEFHRSSHILLMKKETQRSVQFVKVTQILSATAGTLHLLGRANPQSFHGVTFCFKDELVAEESQRYL